MSTRSCAPTPSLWRPTGEKPQVLALPCAAVLCRAVLWHHGVVVPAVSCGLMTSLAAQFHVSSGTHVILQCMQGLISMTAGIMFDERQRVKWNVLCAGKLNSQGQNLLIYGRQFGNVFIGVQPTFGYEGDPMALLFSRSASPHHGFAAYYTYLESIFKVSSCLRLLVIADSQQ